MPEGQEQSINRNRAVLTVVVLIGVLIAGWWLFRRSAGEQRIDLIASFDTAEKRPDASALKLEEVALNGEPKRSIVTSPVPGTRLTYRVRVPDDGWFFVSLGLKPEAWEQEGDGVLFMVGISDGRAYDELFTQHVNPYGDPTNRRWIPVWVDISAYGGEEVDLILNTRSGPPRQEGDLRNDLGVWGAPQIVVR
jgi:hypothetical protein